jgi:hypothetical protein
MTPDQIPALIAQIALADPRVRRDNEAERRGQIDMWAGILADVPADFALQAAHQHYRVSQWPVLPADIATRWTTTAKDRLGRHTDPQPAIDPDRVTAWCHELGATRQAVAAGQIEPVPQAIAAGPPIAIAALVAGIGWTPPSRDDETPYISEQAQAALAEAGRRRKPPEWSVACPAINCKAQPGQPCTGLHGRVKKDVHPSRFDAYLA